MNELLDRLEDMCNSLSDAATALNIEPKAVVALITTGELPARLFKGAWLVSSDDLHAYQRGLKPGTRYEVLALDDELIPSAFKKPRD